jgi:hypothetical protein
VLAQKTTVEVSCRGELVILRFGQVGYSLEFPLALRLSAVMKHEARMAKLSSGDESTLRICVGTLHDASAPKGKRKRFMEKLPELLRAQNVDVEARGRHVTLSFGTVVREFDHRDAARLAQWIRLRGKEARNNAGETAHWTAIAKPELYHSGDKGFLH